MSAHQDKMAGDGSFIQINRSITSQTKFRICTCFVNWAVLGPWRARAAAILADTWAIVVKVYLSVNLTKKGCVDHWSCFPTVVKMAIYQHTLVSKILSCTDCTRLAYRMWKIPVSCNYGSLEKTIGNKKIFSTYFQISVIMVMWYESGANTNWRSLCFSCQVDPYLILHYKTLNHLKSNFIVIDIARKFPCWFCYRRRRDHIKWLKAHFESKA